MTSAHAAPHADHLATAEQAPSAGAGVHQVSVLLYSDDITTRDAVRAAAGRRPARDVEVTRWLECATAFAVTEALDAGGWDVVVLDGEAAKNGGLGLCRELKNEIYDCPPVLVLTGRPQDGWLAAWSLADDAVPHPLDPIKVAEAIAGLARTRGAAR
jgi:DNA-binding response OmpR family regulator